MIKIKILGFEFFTKSAMESIKSDIIKKVSDDPYGTRTQLDPSYAIGGDVIRVPYYPMDMRTLYDVARYSDVLSTVIYQLKREIFRNGVEVAEEFAKKCIRCGKEFENPVDKCDNPECINQFNLRGPDTKQKEMMERFMKNVNFNKQSLLDLSSEKNDDLEIIDDAYIIASREYILDDINKEIIDYNLIELTRSHPFYMRIIADRTGRPGRDENGLPVMFCINHRDTYHKDKTHCNTCGMKMTPAWFRGQNPDGSFIYYGEDEVFHVSKYQPSLTYGFSNILKIWLKVTTLMNMDFYINKYYSRQRPPRGLLFVRTPNMESLQKMWNWTLDQFKKNPHQIPPIGIEGNDIKGKFVEFIDFMRSLDEMQFIESRDEFRKAIGACYGIMPLFMGDTSTSGGLNNEGLQITVTNRAIESGQEIYNEKFYPWVCKQLKITDYAYKLKPSEEKDEAAEEQLKMMRIRNAMMMQQLGYDVTLNEEEEFEFEPTEIPVTPRQQQGMGGITGIGGLGEATGGIGGSNPFPREPSQNPMAGQENQRFTGEPQNVERRKLKKKRLI